MQERVNLWTELAPVWLACYPASPPTSTARPALVVCPGGAYREHAAHKGHDYAVWLSGQGLHAFVLSYRLGSAGHRHPAPLHDLARAMRYVRHHAKRLGVDPRRVGVVGSSAGGHLAATLGTHAGEPRAPEDDLAAFTPARPDLLVLCYPLISMVQNVHVASRGYLLGELAAPAMAHAQSHEHNVTAKTPACFLWHTAEDQSVSVSHSLYFAQALARAGVAHELHVFERGRHGLGLRTRHPWPQLCLAWLRERGFFNGAVAATPVAGMRRKNLP